MLLLAQIQGTTLLEDAGVVVPRLTAEVLLCHAVHCERVYLYAHPEQELRQVDETGLERLHLRRDLLELAFGGNLAAHLQDARRQFLQRVGAKEMLGTQFGGWGPILGLRKQVLVVVGDCFVR